MRWIVAGLVILSSVGAATAQTLSTSNRTALFRSQTAVLDGRAASQYANSVRLQPTRVVVPGSPSAEGQVSYNGRYSGPYLTLARTAARRHGIPEDLFLRLVQQESGWNARARSHVGAQGLAQIMPATAAYLGIRDVWDPEQNLDGGARYLKEQFATFRSWRLALAAYNAGPEAVRRHGGVPPYAETQGYVRAILGG
ncbi:lytic transglycosylase domain-containing protein [Histidinibacterium aquaticum]|uniref:Lytic transglycosylase domain-containing protein n=1 Tax=Histidinibacterium aquaticum TaxID=2613962 RepID=A0A5J5GL08_9RHOB|nr:lytic transglycosylase domain-containing protein [Histidinibacterium aquaticum]KAA9008717.1 lytic transglycosylase domain-containing protein [Histidinibacterium aquaticum]